MYRTAIESSAIKEIGYNPEKEILEVVFKNDYVYQYVKLGYDAYDELMKAQSIGSHFMKIIKPRYPFVRVH